MRSAVRDLYTENVWRFQYLRLNMNEINLYDSIFGFFSKQNKIKFWSAEPSIPQSDYAYATPEVFRYIFELGTEGERY